MPESDPAKTPPENGHVLNLTQNARYGLMLFAVYLVLYVVFVILNTFVPSVMRITFLGVSMSVLYGIGLIVAALALALLYAWLCRAPASTPDKEQDR